MFAIMLSCYHAIMLSCYHAIMLSLYFNGTVADGSRLAAKSGRNKEQRGRYKNYNGQHQINSSVVEGQDAEQQVPKGAAAPGSQELEPQLDAR